MNYETLAPILKDVIEFIKSFVATLKDFIHGFKSETRFEGEPYEAE